MGSLDDAIPYEVWSEEERLQHNSHVRRYYWFRFMAQEEMDSDLSVPVPPSEIVKQ